MKDKKTNKVKVKKDSGVSRKEIRTKIQESVNQAITGLHAIPSKKTRKTVKKVSNKIANKIKKDLKKNKLFKNKKAPSVNGEMKKAEAIA